MKVCVLQPDYSTTDVDYKNYDPPRDLSALLQGDEVDHVFLNKLTTYKQLKELSTADYDIYVNLCEGYLEWSVPSIEVPYYLDLLQLPYTGPNVTIYDPSKEIMKYVAFTAGVSTPAFALLNPFSNIQKETEHLRYPLFVKPAKAGDSLGIDELSCVLNTEQLAAKTSTLFKEYKELIIEEYIEGREFTVLVVAEDDKKKCFVYKPLEYVFDNNAHYKTYAQKTRELHPSANVPCNEPLVEKKLIDAAYAIFTAFEGVGYARLDFRLDVSGNLFFLEINFTCSVFYVNGYEGSADYILNNHPLGTRGFLQKIIAEGISRHQQKCKPYKVQGNSLAGFGLYSTKNILPGALIFEGEGKAQRLITRQFVKTQWSAGQQEVFRRYAYPLSSEVFLLWDKDPMNWLPQNHSCAANTYYEGLNVYASGYIEKGEELTLDYSTFLNEEMEPFECHCGEANCRGWITGIPGNSVTAREESK